MDESTCWTDVAPLTPTFVCSLRTNSRGSRRRLQIGIKTTASYLGLRLMLNPSHPFSIGKPRITAEFFSIGIFWSNPYYSSRTNHILQKNCPSSRRRALCTLRHDPGRQCSHRPCLVKLWRRQVQDPDRLCSGQRQPGRRPLRHHHFPQVVRLPRPLRELSSQARCWN